MNFAEQCSLNVHFSIRHEKIKQVGRRDFPLFSIRLAYNAPVAQWIEQRFPKPQVACSIHAGGTARVLDCVGIGDES